MYYRYPSERAIPITRWIAKAFAKLLAITVGKIHKFGVNGPTDEWWRHFQNRYKEEIKEMTPNTLMEAEQTQLVRV